MTAAIDDLAWHERCEADAVEDEWIAAHADNETFDDLVFAILERAEGGTTGMPYDDRGTWPITTVLAHCIARGWVVTDAVQLPGRDYEQSGWITTASGLDELDRLYDVTVNHFLFGDAS